MFREFGKYDLYLMNVLKSSQKLIMINNLILDFGASKIDCKKSEVYFIILQILLIVYKFMIFF